MSESIPEASPPPPLPSSVAEAASVARWRWCVHLLLIGSYPLIIVALGSLRGPDHEPALSQSVRGLLLVCAVELVLFSLVFALGWLLPALLAVCFVLMGLMLWCYRTLRERAVRRA